MRIIVALLLLGSWIQNCLSICTTFAGSCTLDLGKPLSVLSGDNGVIEKSKNNVLYLKFTLPATKEAEVVASMFYGNVELYAAFDREVTTSSYDYRSGAFEDAIEKIVNSGNAAKTVNVLLVAISPAKFRIMAFLTSTSIQLDLGIPQTAVASRNIPYSFVFSPKTVTKINIALTPVNRGDPNMVITGPSVNGGEARSWISNSIGADYILLEPLPGEINKNFVVQITASNSSIFTLLASESTEFLPATILGGFPFDDIVAATNNLYYILHVPPGVFDVIIMVTPVFGDADLFVNTKHQGFFTPDPDHPGARASWQSELSYGTDTVLIQKSDKNFILSGGEYYITVHGIRESRFIIRGFSAGTVVTLAEGSAIHDTISSRTYHYYRFIDTHSSEDLIFDVSPSSGDPDIFVGCRLNPAGNDTGFPSRKFHHYNFSSQRSGEDGILVAHDSDRKCHSGVYYLGVYAFTEAQFSLTASHQNSVVRLQNGIPETFTVYAFIPRYFKFIMGPQPEQLTISMTPYAGDCDLYVKMNGVAKRIEYDYKSEEEGMNVDRVVIPEREVCINCQISILILPYVSGEVTIVASLVDTTIELNDGLPLREMVGENYIQYYSLEASHTGKAHIVLTVFSGKPFLFLSTAEEKPTATTPDTQVSRATLIGGLPTLYRDVTQGQRLYIGVGGVPENCTYTIRASITATSETPLYKLIESVPQADDMSFDRQELWRYYQISVPEGHEPIEVRAGRLVGDVDLFVLKCPFQTYECAGSHDEGSVSYLPTESTFTYSTVGQESDWLTITRNDPVPCSYIVGVISRSLYAEYRISMSLSDSILVLLPGIAVVDHAEENEFDYFSYFVSARHQEITFTLTPVSGDADMFISTNYRRPNETHSSWRSTRYGVDAITINVDTDQNACSYCTYYIGVVGYSTTTYNIIATTATNAIRLVDGQPLSGHASPNDATYYMFVNTYGVGRSLRLSIVARTGTFSAYVTLDGTDPSFTNHVYAIQPWLNDATSVNILKSDSKFEPCLDAYCAIRVGIVAESDADSTFIITLSTSLENTLLQIGVPFEAQIAEKTYDYFKVARNKNSGTMHFSITQLSGRVAMMISCHHAFPNITISNEVDWTLNPGTTNTIEISNLDLKQHGCANVNTLFLSVYSYRPTSTYSILVTSSDNSTVPELMFGMTISEFVPYLEMDYFAIFPNSKFDDIQITATVMRGDVDIYISDSWENRPVYSYARQAVVSYQFRSNAAGSEAVFLRHDLIRSLCSAEYHGQCYFIVAVFGAYEGQGAGSSYRIVASTHDSTVELTDGVPHRSHIGSGASDSYKYTVVDSHSDIVISVTPFYGDPDIFVGLAPNYHPGLDDYTWMSGYWGADTLIIQAGEFATKCTPSVGNPCIIYMTVYSYSNSSYSILTQTDNSNLNPVTLIDGVPQSGYVLQNHYSYYSFFVSANEHGDIPVAISITLTPQDESDQDIFVSFSGEPGRRNFDYNSVNFGGVSDEIKITAGMAHFCVNCFVHIAVYGFNTGHFSIVASSAGMVHLQVDTPIAGHCAQGTYNYYSFHNTDPTAILTFTLTPITGDPDLYINTRTQAQLDQNAYHFPSMSNTIWRSGHAGADSIRITYNDRSFCVDCDFVVGVYAYRNASYTLLLTTEEDAIINLVVGRPQRIHVPFGALSYLAFTSTSSTEDITISLTKLGSANVVMVMEKYKASSPNVIMPDPTKPSSYSYSSQVSGSYTFVVKGPFAEPYLFIIAVSSSSPSDCSILASSSKYAITLASGIPQAHYVAQGSMVYFKYFLSDLEDLQVTINVLNGDPDLLINFDDKILPICQMSNTPSSTRCFNYTLASTSYLADQILVSKDFPCSKMITSTAVSPTCNAQAYRAGKSIAIGVYGYTTSRFVVMATPRGYLVRLIPGMPQISSTSLGYICTRTANGNCQGSSSNAQTAQVSYFAYEIMPDGASAVNQNIILSIRPSCNSTSEPGQCTPGCDCLTLTAYVKSCSTSKCNINDQYPSYQTGRYDISRQISPQGTTIVLNTEKGYNSAGLCNPKKSKDGCTYYISVISRQTATSVVFEVSALTPNDVEVVPCTSTSDNLRVISSELSSRQDVSRIYEVCTSSSGIKRTENLIVTLEECVGSATLLACGNGECQSYLPTASSWSYLADDYHSCSHTDKKHSPKCESDGTRHPPRLSLPATSDTYHLRVNGTGYYNLYLQNTVNSHVTTPQLVSDGVKYALPSASNIKGTSLTVKWSAPKVSMPSVDNLQSASLIRYVLYLIDNPVLTALSKDYAGMLNTNTPCGLDFISSQFSHAVQKIPLTVIDKDDLVHTLSGLDKKTSYTIKIVASCDGECLKQVTKLIAQSTSCGSGDCSTEYYVYDTLTVTTTNEEEADDSSYEVDVMIFIVIVVIAVAGVAVYKFMKSYRQVTGDVDDDSAFEMTDFGSPSDSAHTVGLSQHDKVDSSSHHPPAEEENPLKAFMKKVRQNFPKATFGPDGKSPYSPVHDEEEVTISL